MTKQEEKELREVINEFITKFWKTAHTENDIRDSKLENFYKNIKKEIEWKQNYYKEGCENSKIGSTIRIIYESKLQVTNDILDYLNFYYGDNGENL